MVNRQMITSNSWQTITRGSCVSKARKPLSSRAILIYFEFRSKPPLITVICMGPHSPNKLFATKYCFLILGDDSSFFFLITSLFFAFFFVILCYFVIINFYKNYVIIIILFNSFFFLKITFIFSCSGMFRDVLECTGMFRVPGFIDALLEHDFLAVPAR